MRKTTGNPNTGEVVGITLETAKQHNDGRWELGRWERLEHRSTLGYLECRVLMQVEQLDPPTYAALVNDNEGMKLDFVPL